MEPPRAMVNGTTVRVTTAVTASTRASPPAAATSGTSAAIAAGFTRRAPSSAVARSAIRSSGLSRPIERRSKSAGTGDDAPSVLRRCSIRLSTPPSDVPRLNTLTAARTAIAAASPPASLIEQHPSEPAAHLARGDHVTGMRRQPWIEHGRQRRMSLEVAGDPQRRGGGVADSHEQRAHAPLEEPGFERPEHGAGGAPPRPDPLRERVAARRHDGAGQDVAVPVEVLRRRMDDEVGAELDRASEHRRRDGVVDDDAGVGVVRDLRDGGEVDDVPRGIRRRLEPQHPCPAGTHRASHGRPCRWYRRTRRRAPTSSRTRRASAECPSRGSATRRRDPPARETGRPRSRRRTRMRRACRTTPPSSAASRRSAWSYVGLSARV